MKNIVLIGMMGCGKTTLGRLLAIKLQREFIDTDDLIVKQEGIMISDIFKTHGADYFRALEQKYIVEVSSLENKVIATGGGIVLNPKNIENLKMNGIIIYLKRDLEDIKKCINTSSRPLLGTLSDLDNIYNERKHLYEAYADFIVQNDDVDATINEIIQITKDVTK